MSVFATSTVNPTTLNISSNYSKQLMTLTSNAECTNAAQFIKIAPIDPSTSAVWNSTNLTTLTLLFDNGQEPGSPNYVSQAATVTSPVGGATNITGTVTPANLTTALAALVGKNVLSGNLSLVAYDGTTYVLVATGKWNLTIGT